MPNPPPTPAHSYDLFISHASEDKESFVRPLAEALLKRGLRIWYDEFALTVGDSIRRRIDEGLRSASFAVVVLSPSFFAKEWPRKELDALFALESDGSKRILPIWHGIDAATIRSHSPLLADRLAVVAVGGVEHVVDRIVRALGRAPVTAAQASSTTPGTSMAPPGTPPRFDLWTGEDHLDTLYDEGE
jgi:hypothetical protein